MSRKQPKRAPRPGVDEYGRTELHYAAADGDAHRVRQLIAKGAVAGLPDDNGWTPLHFAAQAQDAATCETLLEAGAPIDAADSYGNTPLSRAFFTSRGRGEVILLLRARGARIDLANANGVSPASLAQTIANFDVAQFFPSK